MRNWIRPNLRLWALVSGVGVILALVACAGSRTVSMADEWTGSVPEPFVAGFRKDLAAATPGNPEAWDRLGARYENGLGVEPDLGQAIIWYRKAAEAGDAKGALALGTVLGRPELPGQLKEPPEPWLQQAAEAGLARAQFALAERLRGGANPRPQGSAEWLNRALQQGYVPAVRAHAREVVAGLISESDADSRIKIEELLSSFDPEDPPGYFWAETMRMFVSARAAGGREAQTFEVTEGLHAAALSLDFESYLETPGQYWGSQVALEMAALPPGMHSEKDLDAMPDEHVLDAELSNRAEAGDVVAACNLGFKMLGEKKFTAAFDWYHRAAVAGAARAVYHLGVLYRDGLGIPVDANQAATWFQKAALTNYPPAQAALGDLLLTGKGVPANVDMALGWLWPAAAYGNPLAEFDLGLAHHEGLGVVQDDRLAVAWIARAAARWRPCSMECTSREGLKAARNWLDQARRDASLAPLIDPLPSKEDLPRSRPESDDRERRDIDTAPFDCLGRTAEEE